MARTSKVRSAKTPDFVGGSDNECFVHYANNIASVTKGGVSHGETATDLSTPRSCRFCQTVFHTADRRRQYCSLRCAIRSSRARNASRQTKYRDTHPDRELCRRTLINAVLSGRVRRPSRCECCGRLGTVEAHHEDYSKPFYIEWLCKACHAIRSTAARAERYGEAIPTTTEQSQRDSDVADTAMQLDGPRKSGR